MGKPKQLVEQITDDIERQVISDSRISWITCVEILNEIEEFCHEWAQTINGEHSGEDL